MQIKREFNELKEQLELNIIGDKKQQLVRDVELRSTSPDIEWERYALINTEQLTIYARNIRRTSEFKTFEIKLQQSFSIDEASGLQQLTMLLMMVLLCCLCMACCTVLLRLRCKFRNQRVGGDNLDDLVE